MQRAAQFLYPQRCAFGGKVSGRNFAMSTDRPGRFNLTTLEPDLEALHSRLSGVTGMCLDVVEFCHDVAVWCAREASEAAFAAGRAAGAE